MTKLSRRDFLQSTALAAAAGTLSPTIAQAQDTENSSTPPVVISSGNGLRATQKAAELIRDGADTLDAVIAGVNIVEEDPEDMTVGYGGLPNEEGVVELDSSVMHGPTFRCGAVGALRNIKTPSKVAKLVMERTDHAMLVGEGALRFARAHGFKEVDLLTAEARAAWLHWRESHSTRDDWLAPTPPPVEPRGTGSIDENAFTYGTITCCALAPNGDMSGVTTTSGLSFKIPGRVGDSPIIGAGLYVDNEVGAAGATGRGESVIRICGAYAVVEFMRQGKTPLEACKLGVQRVLDTTTERRLFLPDYSEPRPAFDVKFYAIDKQGHYGSAAIYSMSNYAVYANGENRIEECYSFCPRPIELMPKAMREKNPKEGAKQRT